MFRRARRGAIETSAGRQSLEGARIEVSGLHLAKGGHELLRGVDATFDPGRITAIVGPSGAGKTSLLRCLNRLEQPDSGRITLSGTDIATLPPTELRARVGMIFQSPVLFEGGVKANLRYGVDEAADVMLGAALERVGLAPSFLDRSSMALSVGQAQRVCIARALIRSPEALLMDEPTSALDVDAAARIEDLVVSLAAGGLTVVVVTHNLAQARRIADRAYLLADGMVEVAGGLDDVEAAWKRTWR